MKVIKNINNNVSLCLDSNNNEVVAFGKGIGFTKPPYEVDLDKIQRTYYGIDPTYINMINDIPEDILDISDKIINYARMKLENPVSSNIVITLADHINFAIARYAKGINLENALLWEIKRFYPQEYELGKYAITQIKERLKVELPEDEAGFIALHFVNAEYGTNIRDALRFPNQMKEILEIVTRELGIKLDEGTLHYERFITHMKFLLQRVYRKELLPDEESDLADMISQKYPKEFACSKKVADYIEKTAECRLSGEEVMYLAIHIRRITMAEE